MSLLLHIDTALETAVVSIAEDGQILEQAINKEQKDHGAFLQTAIEWVAKKAGITLAQLDAIAVVAGPGSYTGLRVGMASAKGLCYALNKPLIAISTLELLACQAIAEFDFTTLPAPPLFCPMIDARRMEVFTAMYTAEGGIVTAPFATILSENSFANIMLNNNVIYFGNGSPKWKQICNNKNAHFITMEINALLMSKLALKKYSKKEFSDVAYAQPMYIKEFYDNAG